MTKPGQTFLKFRATAPLTPAQFSGSVSNRINAAINAAANDGTDVVLSGEYLVEGPILLQPSVKLIGMNSATLKRPDLSAGYDLINLGSEGDNYELRDLILDGNRDGQASEDHLGAVLILDSDSTGATPNSRYLKASGLYMKNFSRGAMGFHAKGFAGVSIVNSKFEDGGGNTLFHSIYLRRVSDVDVSHNQFKNVQYHAIKVQPTTALDRVAVSGNIIDSAGRGIYLSDVANASISGNVITNITGTDDSDGAIVVLADENASGPNVISITGNTINRVVGTGIFCNNTTGAVISGNSIENCGKVLVNARAGRDAVISANALRVNNLTDLVPNGSGGFVDPATLTVALIDIPAGPNSPRITIAGNIYRNGSTATVVGIRTTATAGSIEYGATETNQMSGLTTNLSASTAGILQSRIKPTLVEPQDQRVGTGEGVRIQGQGTAAAVLRADPFDGIINNLRWRNSGVDGDGLAWVFSAREEIDRYIGIRPNARSVFFPAAEDFNFQSWDGAAFKSLLTVDGDGTISIPSDGAWTVNGETSLNVASSGPAVMMSPAPVVLNHKYVIGLGSDPTANADAINAAVALYSGHGSGQMDLYFPSGTYEIGVPTAWKIGGAQEGSAVRLLTGGGLRFVGNGTVLMPATNKIEMFVQNGATDIGFCGIKFDNSAAGILQNTAKPGSLTPYGGVAGLGNAANAAIRQYTGAGLELDDCEFIAFNTAAGYTGNHLNNAQLVGDLIIRNSKTHGCAFGVLASQPRTLRMAGNRCFDNVDSLNSSGSTTRDPGHLLYLTDRSGARPDAVIVTDTINTGGESSPLKIRKAKLLTVSDFVSNGSGRGLELFLTEDGSSVSNVSVTLADFSGTDSNQSALELTDCGAMEMSNITLDVRGVDAWGVRARSDLDSASWQNRGWRMHNVTVIGDYSLANGKAPFFVADQADAVISAARFDHRGTIGGSRAPIDIRNSTNTRVYNPLHETPDGTPGDAHRLVSVDAVCVDTSISLGRWDYDTAAPLTGTSSTAVVLVTAGATGTLVATPATQTGTETLTNKTLTAPVINGLITGTAVTQTALDTTAGRVTRVGDFGLGGSAPLVPGDDLNTTLGCGTYAFTSTALNAPGSAAAGVMQVFTRTPTISAVPSQFHVVMKNRTGGGASMWVRAVTGSSYGAWSEIYNQSGVEVGVTLASLGAASGVPYKRAFITDSNVAASGNFGATAAGGGANRVPVWSDGTNWLIG